MSPADTVLIGDIYTKGGIGKWEIHNQDSIPSGSSLGSGSHKIPKEIRYLKHESFFLTLITLRAAFIVSGTADCT